MKKRRNGTLFWVFWGVAGGLLSALLPMRAYATNTMSLDATLVQAACTISLMGGVTTNGGNVVIPNQESADFAAGKVLGATAASAVTLTLSGCGAGTGSLAPKIVLTGNDWKGTVVGASAGFLFRDGTVASPGPGGTSEGYFIVVGKQANPAYDANGLWAAASPYDVVYAGNPGVGGNGGTVTVYPGVVCTTGSCATAKAGSLKATLVFEFRYA